MRQPVDRPVDQADVLPTFGILGFAKCGTSTLVNWLGQHPDVFFPGSGNRLIEPEFSFFERVDYASDDLEPLTTAFGPGQAYAARGFKRPGHASSAIVTERVAEVMPDLRVVVVMRRPIDRAISSYYHQMRHGSLPPLGPEEGLLPYLEVPDDHRPPTIQRLIIGGQYAQHLKRLETFFPSGQILPVILDDLTRDPERILSQIFTFIGVEPRRLEGLSLVVRNRGAYSLSRLRLLQLRQKLQPPAVELARGERLVGNRSLMPIVMDAALRYFDDLVLSRIFANRIPTISAALKLAFDRIYREEIHALERRLGRDLSAWHAVTSSPS